MPRSFDLSADYRGTVGQVHSAFLDRQYWLTRLADSGADAASLETVTRHDDGAVTVTTTQLLREDRLPALVTQFHPGDLEIVRNETWRPVADGQAHADVTGEVPGAPVELVGTAVLAPTGEGSRLTFSATVAVTIPLVAAKIESFIGARLADLMAAEQRFTTAWIA